MQENVNIPDSTITSALTFRNLVLMNMQQLTNFPYIEKDFDALTDYELLCLVVKYLNDVIANQNEQNDSITSMYESFLALQSYVNNTKDTLEDAFNTLDDYVRNYFANLDVQDEIDHKLDEYVEDGTLEHIIASYLQTQKIYDTHDEMMLDADNIVNGLIIQTLGYHSINDGGGAFYHVVDSESETEYQDDLGNDLYATLLLDDYVNVKQFGAYGDNTHDDTTAFQNAIDFIKAKEQNFSSNIGDGTIYTGYEPLLLIPSGKYIINNVSITNNYLIINGDNAVIHATNNAFNINGGYKISINGIKFIECEKAIYFIGQNQEMGNIRIKNCEFINCSSHGIHITYKQSYIGLIEDCQFFKCYYVLEESNCDLMLMKNCWISESTRTQDYDSSIIANNGEFQMESCLFVPYPTTYLEPSVITGSGYARFTILNSHFGGENGSKALVRIKNAESTCIIDNCQVMYSIKNYATILLETGFDFISIQNCRGIVDNTIPIRWSSLATQEVQDAFVSDNDLKHNIILHNIELDRAATNIRRKYNYSPSNLTKFINTDYNNLKYWKQYYVYEVAQDKLSITITPTAGTDSLGRVDYRDSKIGIDCIVKDYNTGKLYHEFIILSPIVLTGSVDYDIFVIGGLDNTHFSVTSTGNYYTQGFYATITTSDTRYTIENVYSVEQVNDIIRSNYGTLGG